MCRATGRLDYKIEGDGRIHTKVFNALNNQHNPDYAEAGGKHIQIQRQGVVAGYGEECDNWMWWP